MTDDRSDSVSDRLLFLIVLALGLSAGVAVAAPYLSPAQDVSGDVTLVTNSGVEANVSDHGGELNATDWQNDQVTILTANGNVTVSGSGTATLTLTEMNGTWTNVTEADVSSNNVTINPDDKPAATLGGDADSLSFKDVTLDDGQVDVVYGGATGTTTLVLRGLPANEGINLVEGGTLRAAGTTDANGNLTFTGLPNSDHKLEAEASEGGPSLSNPRPQGNQSTFPTTLKVDVDDPDFDDGDNVTVEFKLDGTSVGTDKLTSAGTASVSISQPSRGEHSVTAIATDAVGNEQKLGWTFGTPEEITVRRARPGHAIIDDRQVNATFLQGNDTIETRTTNNGKIDMTGLSNTTDIVIRLNATATKGLNVKNRKYYASEYVLETITEQQTLYLLDQNATVVTSRFTLDDRTGNFAGNGAQLFIQKVINRTGTPEYKTIHSDEFGVEGVTTELVKGERYRLIVKNEDNDVRVLGSYDADVSETVPLEVGAVSANPEEPDTTFAVNVTRFESNGNTFAQLQYNDTENLTSSVTVEIYERGNRSNKILDNQTIGGPLGTLKVTEQIEQNESYVVRASINRDGETQRISQPIGPRNQILTGLAGWVKAVISIGSIFLVAGLFSQLNGEVGALVTAGLGGMWWFVGFLPQETGLGVVVLAMVVAGIIFVNGRRSA